MICCAEQYNQLKPAEGKSGAILVCTATLAGLFIGDKMRTLTLTQGKVALVDDADYEWLNQWKWYAHKSSTTKDYYAVRSVAKPHQKMIIMHRQILNAQPGQLTDHRNHNCLDNRQCNIRLATPSQNSQNSLPKKTGTSKYKGIFWRKDEKKWRATIKLKRKSITIGQFKNEIDAARAYDKKAKELFGEFAYTNF